MTSKITKAKRRAIQPDDIDDLILRGLVDPFFHLFDREEMRALEARGSQATSDTERSTSSGDDT